MNPRLNLAAMACALVLMATACGSSSEPDDGPAASALVQDEAASEATAVEPVATAAQPPLAFATCRSCHAVEPGQNGIGPSLHGVVGRKAASLEGFAYSPALSESGIVWNRETLDQWLTSPIKMVPGTRMVMPVPNPEARTEIIDYLETLK